MSTYTEKEVRARDADRRIAASLLPILLHRREVLSRAIEAIEELQRTDAVTEAAQSAVEAILNAYPAAGPKRRRAPLSRAIEMRAMHDQGKTIRQIAHYFGLSYQRVGQILQAESPVPAPQEDDALAASPDETEET